MTRRTTWRQEPSEREGGYSLPELLVAMALFGGLMAITMGVLISVSQSAADNMSRAAMVGEARIGIMQIDRQVRSGNVISDPADETFGDSGVPPGYSLRVHTQTNGVRKCVQWRVIFDDGETTGGELQYRSWDPDWQSGGTVESWSVVARDLVAGTSGNPPFAMIEIGPPKTESGPPSGTSAQSVSVRLRIQGQRTSSAPTTVETVLTGRNTVYGYPSDACSSVPTP